jgi:glyoxylase-like metal-dependent hydrolase (beta-lactamase superfamily II)/alkylhydroperoxidase family enzyme
MAPSIRVGNIAVTFLSDGLHVADPCFAFPASARSQWDEHPEVLDGTGRVRMPLGGFLVESADRLLMVDMGFGRRRHAHGDLEWSGGSMLDELSASGYRADDIDTVLYTHLHLDHVGWTVERGPGQPRLTCRNAEHVIHQAEWDFWSGSNAPAGGPSRLDLAILPDRLRAIDRATTVAPGIDIVPTTGHTPGHCSVVISQGASRAIIFGDVVHSQLQLGNPEWELFADVDPVAARRSRVRLLDQLADEGAVGAFAHFPGLTFARVVRAGEGRTAIAVRPSGPRPSRGPLSVPATGQPDATAPAARAALPAWLPLRTSSDLTGDAARVLGKLEASGRDVTLFRLLANAPVPFVSFVRFADALMSRGTLADDVREAAILAVAAQVGSAYEWAEHERIARAAGLTGEQIDSLRRGDRDAPHLSPDQHEAAWAAADALGGTPLPGDRMRALVGRFGTGGALEVLLVSSWWGGMVASLVAALGLDETSAAHPGHAQADHDRHEADTVPTSRSASSPHRGLA